VVPAGTLRSPTAGIGTELLALQMTGANAAVPTANSPPRIPAAIAQFRARSPQNFLPAGLLEPQLAQRTDQRAAMKEECHAAAVLDSVEKSGSSPLATTYGDSLMRWPSFELMLLTQPMLVCYIAYL
jgi:hypothetical protein